MADSTPPFPNGRPALMRIDGFTIEKEIGKGACGIVYLARNTANDCRAIKVFKTIDKKGNTVKLNKHISAIRFHYAVADSTREKDSYLKGLLLQPPSYPHAHIVPPLDKHFHETTYLSMPYYEHGDLKSNIKKGEFIGDGPRMKDIFLRIVQAVQHCHSKGIYIGDIKPENMMLSDNKQNVLLTDFGHCQTVKNTGKICFTVPYGSPEAVAVYEKRGNVFNCELHDIWTLGIVLAYLVTAGKRPWTAASTKSGRYQTYRSIPTRQGRAQYFIDDGLKVTEEVGQVLARILEHEPARRITLERLKAEVTRVSTFTLLPPDDADNQSEKSTDYETAKMSVHSGASVRSTTAGAPDETQAPSEDGTDKEPNAITAPRVDGAADNASDRDSGDSDSSGGCLLGRCVVS